MTPWCGNDKLALTCDWEGPTGQCWRWQKRLSGKHNLYCGIEIFYWVHKAKIRIPRRWIRCGGTAKKIWRTLAAHPLDKVGEATKSQDMNSDLNAARNSSDVHLTHTCGRAFSNYLLIIKHSFENAHNEPSGALTLVSHFGCSISTLGGFHSVHFVEVLVFTISFPIKRGRKMPQQFFAQILLHSAVPPRCFLPLLRKEQCTIFMFPSRWWGFLCWHSCWHCRYGRHYL